MLYGGEEADITVVLPNGETMEILGFPMGIAHKIPHVGERHRYGDLESVTANMTRLLCKAYAIGLKDKKDDVS